MMPKNSQKKTRIENLREASTEEIAKLILNVEEASFCTPEFCEHWSLDSDDCPFTMEDKTSACVKACVKWLNSVPAGGGNE